MGEGLYAQAGRMTSFALAERRGGVVRVLTALFPRLARNPDTAWLDDDEASVKLLPLSLYEFKDGVCQGAPRSSRETDEDDTCRSPCSGKFELAKVLVFREQD